MPISLSNTLIYPELYAKLYNFLLATSINVDSNI